MKKESELFEIVIETVTEMCIRDRVSTIINNRLNNVMKFLTSITLVMAIPTIISGLYGMNVSGKWMPLSDTPHGFLIICGLTGAVCLSALLILKRRKML